MKIEHKQNILNKMIEIVPDSVDEFSWDAVTGLFGFLKELEDCPQDPIHHAEGNVGVHTRMVIKELIRGPGYAALDPTDKFKLFWAAVFHDSGKPATSELTDGRITSHGHSRVGSAIAREHLRLAEVPFDLREEICAIITAHQNPFWLYEQTEREQKRRAIRSSLVMKPRHLLMHAMADAKGRISTSHDNIVEKVMLSSIVFEDLNILDEPFSFVNDESRFAFFEREDRDPFYEAHGEFRSRVTLMSGLPGSGKDTWIAKNRPGLPVLSPDDIRLELGIEPTDNQGTLRQVVKERAKELLRSSQDFVWNATNVTNDMRGPIIKLLRDYHAHIEIVYIETTPKTLIAQNGQRKASVPVDVIERLARKLDPPKPWEGHIVTHVLDNALTAQLHDTVTINLIKSIQPDQLFSSPFIQTSFVP